MLLLVGAAALVAWLLLGGVSAPSASAGTLPAICEQYPDLPQCQEPTGPTGPTGPTDVPGPTGTTDVPGPTADLGDGGGGELPFTGYPLTGLILLLLLLLLAGLAIRAYLALRDRLDDGSRSP